MKTFTLEELTVILEDHRKWLNHDSSGKRANLRVANLTGVDLRGADLRLANLIGTNLTGANFTEADLTGAILERANLTGANLTGANFTEADLTGANLTNTIGLPQIACPETGSFIGYKAVRIGEVRWGIATLEIPSDAKRSSSTSNKCRCSKAKVLKIENLKGNVLFNTANSEYDPEFIYRVGESIEVSDFDDNRWNECAPGIHFFMSRKDAVDLCFT